MNLTPKQITEQLDRYIIGQAAAKRAVAVALRNRYRRSQLPREIREEITPKNIIMKGPTGVGKTEIARRLAKLVKAPFIKVEATKYTEVGYVGRDVESMIRDLVETSVRLVREEKIKTVSEKALGFAHKRICDILYKERKEKNPEKPEKLIYEELLTELKNGKLDKTVIEIEIDDNPRPIEVVPGTGAEIDIGTMFGGIFPKRKKKRKVTVKEALNFILAEEASRMIDNDSVNAEAIRRAEQEGIIFIDEIDKIASKGNKSSGPDVSREGVQRDILPIVEGSTISTKYGTIKTDYILFIAAGAFHISKVEDLIPELQGRFPITVELESLNKDDFLKILTIPENAITKQYATLLAVDKIILQFKDDALEEIANIAVEENISSENIGARRLHTIMESLLEDISYNAGGDHPETKVVIDKKYVYEKLSKQLKSQNLKKYIL
ncbi:MAG: ATP-dependent protease ATPase subunit HslU [Firmicutes bacterium]|nr:ATP-dependent protease ATPase subunit HslU [Bacillota bacterium]